MRPNATLEHIQPDNTATSQDKLFLTIYAELSYSSRKSESSLKQTTSRLSMKSEMKCNRRASAPEPKVSILRDHLIEHVAVSDVCKKSTRPAAHAVHLLSFYQQRYSLTLEDFPNPFAANDCRISLPLFHGMTDAETGHVIGQGADSFNMSAVDSAHKTSTTVRVK